VVAEVVPTIPIPPSSPPFMALKKALEARLVFTSEVVLHKLKEYCTLLFATLVGPVITMLLMSILINEASLVLT
jgi:cytochrome c oxidase subunit IV